MTIQQWWLVSDLHVGLDDDARDPAARLARFVDLVVRPRAERTALVLLGDTFDLACANGVQTAARLEAIAARRPEVFRALAGCLARGVDLHLVGGNHDYDLSRPAARTCLTRLIGDRIQLHPWAIHVPGVFFAEHGHQHHLVHRLPTMLRAAADDRVAVAPSALTVWAHPSGGPGRRASDLVRALAAARQAEAQAGGEPYGRLLDRQAAELQLTRAAARALWQATRFRPLPALYGPVRRTLRDAAGRPAQRRPPSSANRMAATLRGHGVPVRWYVTGHTHRAGGAPIADTGTEYLNTGTWSSDVRGPGPDQDDRALFPVVGIRSDRGEWSARLCYWHGESAVLAAAPVDDRAVVR